ncbi:MAG: hypothetical protein ACRCZZ_07715 [Phocaeicola sp.]
METEVENRFAWTWSEYVKALHLDPNLTFRKFCERVHTDRQCIQKWASRRGHSVLRLKKELFAVEPAQDSSPTIPFSKEYLSQRGSIPSFSRVVPIKEPEEALSLLGISVTFTSGTIVIIKQGTPSGVIKLIQAYERKDGELCML